MAAYPLLQSGVLLQARHARPDVEYTETPFSVVVSKFLGFYAASFFHQKQMFRNWLCVSSSGSWITSKP